MSIDCAIKLPAYVRISDVATAMGILAGLPVQRRLVASHGYIATARPEGLILTATDTVGVAKIEFRSPLFGFHHVLYFLEADNDDGGREMLPPSTAFWIAMGKRLVDFFGGQVVYRDNISADEADDHMYKRATKPRKEIVTARDGRVWQALQEELATLTPLTIEEVDAARALCGYPDRQEYGFLSD